MPGLCWNAREMERGCSFFFTWAELLNFSREEEGMGCRKLSPPVLPKDPNTRSFHSITVFLLREEPKVLTSRRLSSPE